MKSVQFLLYFCSFEMFPKNVENRKKISSSPPNNIIIFSLYSLISSSVNSGTAFNPLPIVFLAVIGETTVFPSPEFVCLSFSNQAFHNLPQISTLIHKISQNLEILSYVYPKFYNYIWNSFLCHVFLRSVYVPATYNALNIFLHAQWY